MKKLKSLHKIILIILVGIFCAGGIACWLILILNRLHPKPEFYLTDILFDHSGRKIVGLSPLLLWNMDGDSVTEYKTAGDPLTGITEFSPDGRFMLIKENRSLLLYNTETGKSEIICNNDCIACFSGDGSKIWYAPTQNDKFTKDGIYCFNLNDKKVTETKLPEKLLNATVIFCFRNKSDNDCLVFIKEDHFFRNNPTGNKDIRTRNNQVIRIFDPVEQKIVKEITADNFLIENSLCRKGVLVLNGINKLAVINLNDGSVKFSKLKFDISSHSYSWDGKMYAGADWNTGELEIVETETGKTISRCIPEKKAYTAIMKIAFSGDNRYVAACSIKTLVKPVISVYEVKSGKLIKTIKPVDNRFKDIWYALKGGK
jgi:WD40 repeat protein